ncbi:MAG: hypothetical protein LBQ61_08985, partial [Spirochaetales bacterium]|nr:hypothetical protein [Spirochaetales bacterium]
MYKQRGIPIWTVLLISSVFCTCGELDTVLPSSGTYKVNALVNETSLNDSSLISKNDRIYPFFASSVTDDPDITGLLVFLQGPGGETVGKKIHYTLEAPGKEAPREPIAEPIKETAAKPVTEKPKEQTPESADETAGEGDPDSPEPELEQVKPAPAAPLPEPVKTEISEKESLIHVNRLDKDLPPFSLPEDLEIGQYALVFQVLGEKEILYQMEKNVYYLKDAAFSLKDIQSYLPDVSTGSHLIPLGITIMLEARVFSDARLDPYIIWYNGKKRISEGRFSEGAGLILWKAPEQTGFHTIRAEAFPYKPVGGISGRSREISLPISAKAVNSGYFSGEAGNITYWYQFRGNLQDSQVPVATERALVPKGERASQWTHEDTIYGLTVGSKDIYLLPAFSFASPGEKQGAGRFMLRFKPVSEGTIFSALFKSESSPADNLYLNLDLAKEGLKLDLISSGETLVIPSDYTPERYGNFITLFIDFSANENHFELT